MRRCEPRLLGPSLCELGLLVGEHGPRFDGVLDGEDELVGVLDEHRDEALDVGPVVPVTGRASALQVPLMHEDVAADLGEQPLHPVDLAAASRNSWSGLEVPCMHPVSPVRGTIANRGATSPEHLFPGGCQPSSSSR